VGLKFRGRAVLPGAAEGRALVTRACQIFGLVTVACVTACGDTIAPFDGTYDFRARFESGDTVRSAVVHVPSGYDGTRVFPLVLAYHGSGSRGDEMQRETGLDAHRAAGFAGRAQRRVRRLSQTEGRTGSSGRTVQGAAPDFRRLLRPGVRQQL